MSSTGDGIPVEVLNDVFPRFILPEAKNNNDPIRLCFAMEMAHWFYLDYIRPLRPELPECDVESFIRACDRHMPSLLKQGLAERRLRISGLLKEWRGFKKQVPVYGAMMITPDNKKVLLVEGYSTKQCWTFPRGKIEEREDPFECAVREVREETNYDISKLAFQSDYIEKVWRDRRVRLYVVRGVPENTLFYPSCRGEIANYRWFPFEVLPGSPGASSRKKEQFFMVKPFVVEYLRRSGRAVSESESGRRNRGASITESNPGARYPDPPSAEPRKHLMRGFSASPDRRGDQDQPPPPPSSREQRRQQDTLHAQRQEYLAHQSRQQFYQRGQEDTMHQQLARMEQQQRFQNRDSFPRDAFPRDAFPRDAFPPRDPFPGHDYRANPGEGGGHGGGKIRPPQVDLARWTAQMDPRGGPPPREAQSVAGGYTRQDSDTRSLQSLPGMNGGTRRGRRGPAGRGRGQPAPPQPQQILTRPAPIMPPVPKTLANFTLDLEPLIRCLPLPTATPGR